jgi:NADH-quinone oxidoreductase subunit L
LVRKLPGLTATFGLCAAALAGLPLTAGFLSKEAILNAAWTQANAQGGWAWLPLGLALLGSLLTAAYLVRLTYWVFLGDVRNKIWHNAQLIGQEVSAWAFRLPLAALALASLALVFSPFAPLSPDLAWPMAGAAIPEANLPIALALGIPLLGLFFGWLGWRTLPTDSGVFFRLARVGFGFDFLYKVIFIKTTLVLSQATAWWDMKVVDGLVRAMARLVYAWRDQDAQAPTGVRIDTGELPRRVDHPLAMVLMVERLEHRLVDGAVRATAQAALETGRVLQRWQTGQVQTYLWLSLLLAAVAALAAWGWG